MTNEQKQLLLKDLCARLPYGVKIKFNDGTNDIYNLDGNIHGRFTESVIQAIDDLELKPYLRQLSSMTEEEENEYNSLNAYEKGIFPHTEEAFDWLNARHLDYRGLIEKDLALEAPKDMYDF